MAQNQNNGANYSCKIIESNGEFDAFERVYAKDLQDATPLDDATQQEPVYIHYEKHVILGIHNEKADTPDYEKVVVIDDQGRKFACGSATFRRELESILAELSDAGIADFWLKVYRLPSNNYKGKDFITCSLCRGCPVDSIPTCPDEVPESEG